MQILPTALVELIDALGSLPGVGTRTAERYAYFLYKSNPDVSKRLAASADTIHQKVAFCRRTFALVESGKELSDLYTSPNRHKTQVMVVAEPFDILAIEKTNQYKGTYHVLGGLVSPIDGVSPEQLHVAELVERIDSDQVEEIILATNASVEGESTALYIQQQLAGKNIIISRLARGLSVGVDLEYADQITLGRALQERTNL